MKRFLTAAPLVYAVIHLRFSDVPSLSTISPNLIKALHTRMVDEGFPEKIESTAETINLNIDSATQEMKTVKLNQTRYLFRASGEKDIVEVSENSIILKSTNYETFETFYDMFHRVLTGCLDTIEGLDKALLKSVGLRYTDVIAPSNGYSLSDFVSSEILPPSLDMLETVKHLHGTTLKIIETQPGQFLKIHFEELPCQDKKIHKVLPSNLSEPDSECALIIKGHQSWLQIESETYGLLDIDHTHNFNESPSFDAKMIEGRTQELYQCANEVFWGVITEQAKESWGYKEA